MKLHRVGLAIPLVVVAAALGAAPASATTPVSVTTLSTNLPFVSPWPQGVGGQPVTLTVGLSDVAPTGGAVVKVSKAVLTPGPVYTLDTGVSVTVPAGQSTASVTIPSLPTSSFIIEQLIATTSVTATTMYGTAGTAIAFTPPASGAPTRVQAESGQLAGSAAVVSTFIGGVVGKTVAVTGIGAGATYRVSAATAGSRTMVLNYATPRGRNGGRFDLPPQISVNVNGSATAATLRLTPGSTAYAWTPVTVGLAAGNNTVTITSADGRAFNLDWLELSLQ